jgi:hypothetical protein
MKQLIPYTKIIDFIVSFIIKIAYVSSYISVYPNKLEMGM